MSQDDEYAIVGTKVKDEKGDVVMNLNSKKISTELLKAPLLLIGSIGVVGSLGYGLYSLVTSSNSRGQQLGMRMRVGLQATALFGLIGYGIYQSHFQSKPIQNRP